MDSRYLINTKTPFSAFINHYPSSVAHSHFDVLSNCNFLQSLKNSAKGVQSHLKFSKNVSSHLKCVEPKGGGGDTCSIRDLGYQQSFVLQTISCCEPKKVHGPEILHPKKCKIS